MYRITSSGTLGIQLEHPLIVEHSFSRKFIIVQVEREGVLQADIGGREFVYGWNKGAVKNTVGEDDHHLRVKRLIQGWEPAKHNII